ncbi:MAG: hypothetical protein ACJ76H_07385 [Bacteriovoracaceae bacterium]
MKSKLFLALLFATPLYAADLTETFTPGKGTLYQLEVQGQKIPVDVSIYVASSAKDHVNIEYFLSSRESLIPVEMWQQFEIAASENGSKVTKGFIQTKELKNPETLTDDYLKGLDGVQVNDFLFSSESELSKDKVGEEMVEVPAGKDKAMHYRTVSGGSTIDYWISDSAKPIGLVKLVSKHPSDQKKNYTLALTSLMKNVKPFIDPAKAVPLSSLGKSLLAKPESIR